MRMASMRCCRTWLAQAASRAILIDSMVEVFTVKSEPRKRAQTAAAMADSISVEPRRAGLTGENIFQMGSKGRADDYGNYNRTNALTRASRHAIQAANGNGEAPKNTPARKGGSGTN